MKQLTFEFKHFILVGVKKSTKLIQSTFQSICTYYKGLKGFNYVQELTNYVYECSCNLHHSLSEYHYLIYSKKLQYQISRIVF